MTNTGRIETDSGHEYLLDGKKVPTVTEILNAEPKAALIPWERKMIAACAREHRRSDMSDAEFEKFVKVAAKRYSGLAADLGTRVHKACENYINGTDANWDDDVAPFMAAFESFVADWEPRWLLSEVCVFSRRYGYAGTLDTVARLPRYDGGTKQIIDIKTGNNIHPGVGMQLAAYRQADFFLNSVGQEEQMPAVGGGLVLHLRPNRYSLVPVACGGEVFRRFQYCKVMHEWGKQFSKTILGEPLVAPTKEAAV